MEARKSAKQHCEMSDLSYKRLKQEVLHSNVIGMQGQRLGQIDEIVVDVHSGSIVYVMLATQWSSVQLSWDSVAFDEHEKAFRIKKRKP